MKRSAPLEQTRVRQPRAGGGGSQRAGTVATVEGVKLSPARKGEPIGLLEEHNGIVEVKPIRTAAESQP
jgi:hypothetical protein